MKILRLSLAGFGPYRTGQTVDFEQFDSDGIFLISGRTGAGKSSLLDAICYALYNAIPRYEGGGGQIRSHHCRAEDPTVVELEFSIRGNTYRLTRSPEYERPARRGGGMTREAQRAQLDILDGGRWRGLATGPRDVGVAVSGILPIEKDQFLQVILLAQNRFQKFLLAKTEERRLVLRTLFGTARFEKLELSLIERRKQLDAEVAATRQEIALHAATVAMQAELDETIAPDLEWFQEALATVTGRQVVATASSEAAAAAADAAERRFQELTELRARQQRRSAAVTQLAECEERAPAVTEARAALDSANRAERVRPQIDARRAAQVAVQAAQKAEDEAWTVWAEFSRKDSLDLTAHVEALTAQLGALESGIAEESSLLQREREIAQLAAGLAACHADIEVREQRIGAIPDQLEQIEERRRVASALAATLPDRRRELERLAAGVESAKVAVRMATELSAAQQAVRVASAANRAASVAFDELLDRRHAGIASELAAALRPGDPCRVCGSAEHPAPAAPAADPVTPKAMERAKATLQEAQDTLRAATEHAHTMQLRLAEAQTIAGERTLEECVAEHAAQQEALAIAERAERELAAAETESARLRSERERQQRELIDAHATRDGLRMQQAEATATLAEAIGRVREHRGDYSSVRERADRLRAERDAARRLDQARHATAECTVVLARSSAALAEQLAEQGFPTAAAAEAARLSKREVAERGAMIRQHEDELAAARAVVADPELTDLPAEEVDPEPAHAELRAARAARDEALRVRATLEDRAGLVRARVQQAGDLFGRSAALLLEHEQVRTLAQAVHGEEPNTRRMRLETFVLAAQLEQIIEAANIRLRTMTDGRYTLRLDDERQYRNAEAGLGISVLDEHTGLPRQTASLSGGEMFLASLSLALGLAEVVSQQAGGLRLDTLFVDEGFGSLDSETLDTAMHALDSLRAGGRTIGLISHVDSMKEQIPAKLEIAVAPTGESSIETPRGRIYGMSAPDLANQRFAGEHGAA